ncbi:methyltransferase domain-containing protein [Vibrio penaeicida]|uniref:SAM-dependent methyltransferase n=1 Tax=Vibrio penaeicida TaxID=104609 RepID=A0AAV5NTW4_9VIBR|nr:SAM-dependent methyltransferase [Vibrio penaeicida]RTZ21200.1 SAM-dependent methyltransferase [Vibrio penaeicida]GLQ74047.1 SAM-dependent methyltransferase [Vibrio penaeicida]
MDDFYLEKKWLAGYFEIEWLDKLRELGIDTPLESRSKNVPDKFVFSEHSRKTSALIADAVSNANISPETFLEVGVALGRNCYELAQRLPSIRSVTAVEPSQRFISNFKHLLIDGGPCDFPYIKGLGDRGFLQFDAAPIASTCSHIDFNLIESTFETGTVQDKFDLCVCLNVLDQCESPKNIVSALMDATKLDAILVLSCTYQWNKKHLKDENEAVDDINEYFGEAWEKLSEDEVEYKLRVNERYSYLFLSHVVIYKKVNP